MLEKMNKILLTIFVLCFIFTAGCENDVGEIENLNFATAVGVDYRDEEYYVYIQMIGLNTVAKREGSEKSEPNVYVSVTRGKTFIDGFFKAYHSAQERFLWANVTAIVLSENVLKEGLGTVFDGLTRYYEFRPTPWIFGTKDSMDEILSIKGFFNQSSLNTILHNPNNLYKQSSTIKPLKLNQFARDFFEPGRTTSIPSLSLEDSQWKKNNKHETKLSINGSYFLFDQKYKGYFPFEEIKGIRWVDTDTIRASILVPSKNNPEFITVLEDQMVKILPEKQDGDFRFNIFYYANGIVSNRIKNNTNNLNDMEEFVKNELISEVRQLYQLGLEHDVDFLNLEHQLFRKFHSDWERLKEKKTILHEDSIKSIEAHITIEHSGSFKNRKITVKE